MQKQTQKNFTTTSSELMSHFHILGPATRAILHYKQRVCDLINGYIRKQERKWKLKPSFFMCYLVVRYHEGNEQFNKPLSEKLLYQFESNGKKLSYLSLIHI